MGASFFKSCKTREQLVAKIVEDKDFPSCTIATLAYAEKTMHVWVVQERTVKSTGEKIRSIKVYFIEVAGGELGYKDVSEDEGPYAFDCPLSFLNLVPPPKGNMEALEWRLAVRRCHARTESISRLVIGDKVLLEGVSVPSLKVTSKMPFLGIDDQGQEFIIDPTVLKSSPHTGKVMTI